MRAGAARRRRRRGHDAGPGRRDPPGDAVRRDHARRGRAAQPQARAPGPRRRLTGAQVRPVDRARQHRHRRRQPRAHPQPPDGRRAAAPRVRHRAARAGGARGSAAHVRRLPPGQRHGRHAQLHRGAHLGELLRVVGQDDRRAVPGHGARRVRARGRRRGADPPERLRAGHRQRGRRHAGPDAARLRPAPELRRAARPGARLRDGPGAVPGRRVSTCRRTPSCAP